jgi:hypothetical protein
LAGSEGVSHVQKYKTFDVTIRHKQLYVSKENTFAIGKYFGTCMDEMLVDFYDNEQTGAPNMNGSHFYVNKSSNMPANKEEVFLKLVFPGVFRHIFCDDTLQPNNKNRNCANASALVWLLENVMKKTSLEKANKHRLRTYLIVRTKKPVAKKQRRQRQHKKNVG